MSVISTMQITLREGVKAQAIEAFKARGVFSECAEAIPGFLWAHLLAGAGDTLCVMSEWRNAQSYEDWLAHPARAAQEADLAHYLAAAPETGLFEAQDTFERAR
ncbi:antibiotic biosynthesis monooxygenase family protein [Planktotalea sp.]|uniref:antibiotic biosynthesis monooxygenase family protein n=1 Tax=Planktotalea sp. TaxID=2029877 RepID=UPI0035C7F45A